MGRLLLLSLVCVSFCFAADAPVFPTPQWFAQHLRPPQTRVELRPPVHLSDYVVDGKLELSLRTCIDLVLQNNTDVELTRLQVIMPADAVTRSLAPFDPTFQGSFSSTRSTQPTTSTLQGAPTLTSLTQPASFSYSQLLPSGTSLNVNVSSEKISTNSAFNTLNPALTSGLSVQFSEPLLRNRFGITTRLAVLVAKSNLKVSQQQAAQQISSLIAAAENAYWDVVQARENLALQNKFMELRKAALDRARKQADDGALLQIDVYQPLTAYASAQVAVVQSRQTLAHAQNTLRQQLGADLDPAVRELPLVLTESYATVPTAPPDKDAAIASALASRPDRLAARELVDGDDLSIRSATEEFRPNMTFNMAYTSQGVGGVYNPLYSSLGTGLTVVPTRGGLSDSFGQVFHFGFPVYSAGIQLSLPMRSRAAAADEADARVQKKIDSLQLRKLEQTVRLQVLNSIEDLGAIQAAMQQAQAEREYAQKRFEAEQRKYELGATQLFFVLDAQTQLNQAENDFLLQSISYRRSLINFQFVTGKLVDEWNIVIQ